MDTVARLIWLERQKNLDAIERGVAAALPRRDSQYGARSLAGGSSVLQVAPFRITLF